ncbi:MAG TPA: 3-hydroxyacyl-ACP dehydratase [Geobacter sp.]|nr:3-hydroxyacyl-ACP dehydratase [Geobacter sp.]
MQIGIDLGSRTIKSVAMKGGKVLHRTVVESGFEPHRQALQLLSSHPEARVVATGYGRHLMQQHAELDVITEIKAHALGARHQFPHCRTILDVGGQDCKVIQLNESGRITSFHMNDKCAAGTGRFLEMMAVSLGYGLRQFDEVAGRAEGSAAINSMCAVFAESEVISLKNRGVPPGEIARSVHLAVASRLCAMVSKTGECSHLVFTGGVANNQTLVRMLEKALGVPVLVPPDPAITGALGAALHV